jgi:ubiquinone/menaquinone biosynthesis C-methylase UbiE
VNNLSGSMSLVGPDVQDVIDEPAVLERMLQIDGARVLELGCGAAEKTQLLAERKDVALIVAAEVDTVQHSKNLDLTGVDKITFKSYGAENIREPDANFDIVLMFKSLHHVPLENMDDALMEIHRVLKPGGFAYISEPVFAGAFNEVMRVFHDEEDVRRGAFEAMQRAVSEHLFDLREEYFFRNQIRMASWEQYKQNIIDVTHTEHRLDQAQLAEVERRFYANRSSEGFVFEIPNRVDLLVRLSKK